MPKLRIVGTPWLEFVGLPFADGAAPITLIDGDKLIDLLIEHGIGVGKRTIEMLEVDACAFSEPEGDA